MLVSRGAPAALSRDPKPVNAIKACFAGIITAKRYEVEASAKRIANDC